MTKCLMMLNDKRGVGHKAFNHYKNCACSSPVLMGLKAIHSDVIMSAYIAVHFSFLNDVFCFWVSLFSECSCRIIVSV